MLIPKKYRTLKLFQSLSSSMVGGRHSLRPQTRLELHVMSCSLLGLLAKIKVLCVLPAHLPLVLDVGTVSISVPPLTCAGFVCCHCTRRWTVLDNTHGKDSTATEQPLPWPLLLSIRILIGSVWF